MISPSLLTRDTAEWERGGSEQPRGLDYEVSAPIFHVLTLRTFLSRLRLDGRVPDK